MPDDSPATPHSRKVVILEGALYFTISALTPAATVLEGDKELDARHIVALILSSIVAGSVALKAFFSQSHGRLQQDQMP